MTAAQELTLSVEQEIDISTTPEAAFESLLARLGPSNEVPGGAPMPMVLEPRPGGRWFRQTGDEEGHLWGLVQVIKAPTILEISGPLFMSYAAINHVQFRITPTDQGCRLSLRHLALGMIDADHRQGVTQGWGHLLQGVRSHAEH
ncbi:MAG: ATPase [Phycisphaeraceae bacterium]|nr:ATPase [Phycisphaeraceae bacterium]